MLSQARGRFYSGTSNVVLPVPNKQHFPPDYQDKSRLCYYGSLFSSVEINSSFYKLPMPATVSKWADMVPDNFRFTFKLWKEITHNKGLIFEPEDVFRFFQVVDSAAEKRGCVLVQFPPGAGVDLIRQLQALLVNLKDATADLPWRIAVEFRHPSWYKEEVYDLLYESGIVLVMHDMAHSASPFREPEQDFVYLRFHGPEKGYRGSYPDDVLDEYAEYINGWLADGRDVFAYFNNTMGNAIGNLKSLNDRVVK
ncbi:DUF72 domain-containing protein [Arcticibacter sp.]|uniref:DUF72 domain-containing protein n=1 Tax=Arcticibacter sp. TaxID=1872630 RepID=UPI00388D462D